ncbi:unnamed protein product [Chironomus riparius]|uniref:Uncharacterized protein n=1 Tax=Chironomus riparius TaxID=315576 RepID=A0A9N9WQF2_9DIPT|nr:unnamed protein product [Chironomus riparius]
MDCYPEYHNHYHHYNSIHNTYFASNNSPSLNRFGSTQLNNEAPQSPLYEGFSRHNLHNHHHLPSNHHFNGQGSSFPPFESNNENSQFYYSNMHQPPPSSYYGTQHPHHQYESYSYPRNIPSNYRYPYGYHQSQHHYPPQLPSHSPHSFYPIQQQQQPQHQPYNNSNSSDHHYNHYPTPPSSSNPQNHQQQGEFNPSTNNLRSNDFSFSSSQIQEGQNSEKLLDKDVNVKHVDTSTINNPNVAKLNESDDKTNNNNKNTRNDQQVSVNPSFEESSDRNSNSPKEIPKDEKAINNKNDDNNTERGEEVAKKHKNESFNENENCVENQQHVQQNEEATPATDYSPESSCKVNKIQQENEKQQQQQQNVTTTNGISKLSEHHNSTAGDLIYSITFDMKLLRVLILLMSTFNGLQITASANIVQTEYFLALNEIQQHLNLSMVTLTMSEEDFTQNVTNLLIQYGENWIRLTNELFERDGFVVDIKNLYRFASTIKSRIKVNISQSLKDIRILIRKNMKFYQIFLKHLLNILNQYVAEIESTLNDDYNLIECWDSYKTVYFEIAFDACNAIYKHSNYQIKYLNNEFEGLRKKITSDIKSTQTLMLKEYMEPFKNRVIIRYYLLKNQQTIYNNIDQDFSKIRTSLQKIEDKMQYGLKDFLKEADQKFSDVYKEIVDCFQYLNNE